MSNTDRKKKLLIVLGIVLVFFIFVIFLSQPASQRGELPPELQFMDVINKKSAGLVKELNEIQGNIFSPLLNEPAFQSLVKYGNWPIEITPQGRANPFSPNFIP